jgi:hypothetical protein
VDRLHVDVDPDPAFQFDADPEPDSDPDPYHKFTHVGKKQFIKLLFTALLVHIVFISLHPRRYHNFQYFGQYFKLFCKKFRIV